jgi:hypothetical protein
LSICMPNVVKGKMVGLRRECWWYDSEFYILNAHEVKGSTPQKGYLQRPPSDICFLLGFD